MGTQRTKFAEAMDAKGIDVPEMSLLSGYSQGYIYKLRRGEQKPSLAAAEKLAALVDQPVDIFLSGICHKVTT